MVSTHDFSGGDLEIRPGSECGCFGALGPVSLAAMKAGAWSLANRGPHALGAFFPGINPLASNGDHLPVVSVMFRNPRTEDEIERKLKLELRLLDLKHQPMQQCREAEQFPTYRVYTVDPEQVFKSVGFEARIEQFNLAYKDQAFIIAALDGLAIKSAATRQAIASGETATSQVWRLFNFDQYGSMDHPVRGGLIHCRFSTNSAGKHVGAHPHNRGTTCLIHNGHLQSAHENRNAAIQFFNAHPITQSDTETTTVLLHCLLTRGLPDFSRGLTLRELQYTIIGGNDNEVAEAHGRSSAELKKFRQITSLPSAKAMRQDGPSTFISLSVEPGTGRQLMVVGRSVTNQRTLALGITEDGSVLAASEQQAVLQAAITLKQDVRFLDVGSHGGCLFAFEWDGINSPRQLNPDEPVHIKYE